MDGIISVLVAYLERDLGIDGFGTATLAKWDKCRSYKTERRLVADRLSMLPLSPGKQLLPISTPLIMLHSISTYK